MTQISYRIAADIGGTFTDIACMSSDGTLVTAKVRSTPHDYGEGILDGMHVLLARLDLPMSYFDSLLHASTIATNTILEGKGANTALVTTAGFRDVLELRRIRVPRLYEPLYAKPEPLVARRSRFEIAERLAPGGDLIVPLDTPRAKALAHELRALNIEAVAICFLHSYANPAHEDQVEAIFRDILPPDCFICTSHDVLPEVREYERTSTAVVNAYVAPVVRQYLTALERRLEKAGFAGRVFMMQSSGGLLDLEKVVSRPATVVESGPAAGVVGAARLGKAAGYPDLITFDMGGTTAKAALIQDGCLSITDDYEVGGGISMSSALAKGGGYALKLPIIDVSEVGAGGGSIVRLDAGGVIKIGPESAGAVPGPACYDQGGEKATVTDANMALGYLNPKALAAGTVIVSKARAEDAIRQALGDQAIGKETAITLLDVAYGIHSVANATMMRAVKAVSTYRGRNPRDFTMLAFGGNGGMHAAALARELNIGRVIVPVGAGVFSAVGLLFADTETGRSLALAGELGETLEARQMLTEALATIETVVRQDMKHDAALNIRRTVQLRYHGQGYELSIALDDAEVTPDMARQLRDDFIAEHQRSYGYVHDGKAIELVSVRVVGAISSNADPRIQRLARVEAAEPLAPRQAYFGPFGGLRETPVIRRDMLSETPAQGPLIIEEYEGTTVVPPDCRAWLDSFSNIVIDLDVRKEA
ncbi:hydantoinase/oxoprolinase family protein [Gluconobacter wancherniae]|uniref:hydantoinase/oxoprolinase family protein n=1 Tax=Gluconobacter wancherniae TaxID=1307955 RepID=UPI001B8AFB27|nr:hydantoinase/oxoprolinase family protein [Gluconobacter wancherniae]MBS1089718.1 hydantoinase/oxoprolinase family protein [Gluconobacter wancherniae]